MHQALDAVTDPVAHRRLAAWWAAEPLHHRVDAIGQVRYAVHQGSIEVNEDHLGSIHGLDPAADVTERSTADTSQSRRATGSPGAMGRREPAPYCRDRGASNTDTDATLHALQPTRPRLAWIVALVGTESNHGAGCRLFRTRIIQQDDLVSIDRCRTVLSRELCFADIRSGTN